MRVSVAAEEWLPDRPVVVAVIASASDPKVSYPVTQRPDGSLECPCRGYRYGSRADGLCRHIDGALEETGYRRTLAFLLG